MSPLRLTCLVLLTYCEWGLIFVTQFFVSIFIKESLCPNVSFSSSRCNKFNLSVIVAFPGHIFLLEVAC